MEAVIMSEPLLKEEPFAEEVMVEAKKIIVEIRKAVVRAAAVEKSVATAASNLGVNMLSANEELVQAHRQLCSVLNIAEVKQRAAAQRLEKQSRKVLRAVIQRVVFIVGMSACIGGVIGGGIAALLLR
jgi:DNA/RNA-binding domain of Phe-tRNA-synthetase-like protein